MTSNSSMVIAIATNGCSGVKDLGWMLGWDPWGAVGFAMEKFHREEISEQM